MISQRLPTPTRVFSESPLSATTRLRTISGERLRLLIVNYEFPPVGGGAGRASFKIASELAARGHYVDVLTSRYADEPAEESIAGISVYRAKSWRKGILHCGIRGALSFLFFGLFRMRSLMAKHDYDMVHYFFSMPSGLLSLYSYGIKGVPYIVSLRGSDVPDYDKSNWRLKFLHGLLRGVNQWICDRSSRVVALSSAHRELALPISHKVPIDVIHNGVDPLRFVPNPAPAPAGPLRLICVSRLIDRKGIRYLLEALTRLKPGSFQLALVGEGPEELPLRELVEQLKLGHRVQFRGYVPNEELFSEYQNADVFVLPTLAEAQGNVVLEAMSCGLPIISTTVGGIPEMVEDGVNGYLVPPRNVEQLATAIEKLAGNLHLRQAMREAGLKRVAEEFTWSVNVDQYEFVYRQSLAPA